MASGGSNPLSDRRPRPLVLVVLDGFGIGRDASADAIAAARMPAWRKLLAEWPNARLQASEEAVGLPSGQMGNSEVGHLNLGAGRPVLQDLPRIDQEIAQGTFSANPALLHAMERASEAGRRLHLMGLIGPGGVHSVDRHAVAITELAAREGVGEVLVHALMDGRDTPPRSGDGYIADFDRRLRAAHAGARIATVGGRYYGMDRDRRWERTATAYDAIVHGRGLAASDPLRAVTAAYERGESDEFIRPTVVRGIDGRVRAGDAVVHFNFRADRARQLVHALVDDDATFPGLSRGNRPRDLLVVTLTEYEAGLPVLVAFPPLLVTSLSEHVAGRGWRQFHVAETEKYAHVTYFFNGGREEPFPNEERLLVPSAKVATYDLQPEMSAGAVTDALVAAIASDQYELIVANYANADMVGHTGEWSATVRACEYLDGCLERVIRAVLEADRRMSSDHGGGALLCATADHGNADLMRDEEGRTVTSHSLNPVPVVVCGSSVHGRVLRDGVLADVAPTLLELLGEAPLPAMTGQSLLVG